MWKRLLTTLLTAALLLPTLAAAALTPSLPDIKGHWAEASIRKAVESGWVDGYPNGSFQPEKTITRAEFTNMLLDVIHLTPDCETVVWMKETALYSPQVPWVTKRYQPRLFDMKDHWLTKQGWLDAAMYSGMVVPKDYNNYIFRPEKPIARYEIALMAGDGFGLPRQQRDYGTASLHGQQRIQRLESRLYQRSSQGGDHRRLSRRDLRRGENGHPGRGGSDGPAGPGGDDAQLWGLWGRGSDNLALVVSRLAV